MTTLIERARRYVAKCPPAVSGQGGHDATYHVACVLVNGFALGEPDALALLREWNQSCLPPWSEAKLVYKIKSAASAHHKEPRGYLLGKNAAIMIDRQLTGKQLRTILSVALPTVYVPPFASGEDESE